MQRQPSPSHSLPPNWGPEHQAELARLYPPAPARPVWAMAGTFATAWTATDRVFVQQQIHRERAGSEKVGALSALRKRVFADLTIARPVTFSAQQVEALPYERDDAVLRDSWAHLRLPFPSVYLSMDNADPAKYMASEMPDGADLPAHLGALLVQDPASQFARCAVFASDGMYPWMTGVAQWTGEDITVAPSSPTADFDEMFIGRTWLGLERALACMHLIESAHAELVEAPASRQVRRQTERKGGNIGLIVRLGGPKKRTESRGGKANYSHRFERRGHWAFYPPGTRMADAAPDKLSWSTDHQQYMRRVWHPPAIVGPDHLPFVPKVRVVRDSGYATRSSRTTGGTDG